MVRKLLVATMVATMGLGMQVGAASAANTGVGTRLHQCKVNAHENYRTRVNNGQSRSVARKHLHADLQRCQRRFG